MRRPTCSAPLTNARAEAGLEEGVRCHSRFLPSPLCLPASCCDVHNRCVCRVGTPSPPCRIICGFTRRGTHNQSVGANFRTARASFLTINQSVCGRAWLSVLRALEEHDTLTHVPNGIPYGARVHRGGRSPPRPHPPSPSPPASPWQRAGPRPSGLRGSAARAHLGDVRGSDDAARVVAHIYEAFDT